MLKLLLFQITLFSLNLADEAKIVSLAVGANTVRYDGDQVFRITPETPEHISFINDFVDAQGESRMLFWKRSGIVGQPIDVHVRRSFVPLLQSALEEQRIAFQVRVADIQRLIDRTQLFNEQRRRKMSVDANASVVGHFVSHADINAWLDSMCKAHANLASCGLGGVTYQNRQIRFIKLGSTSGNGTKPNILVFGGIHAREWLAPATLIHIINRFLTTYQSDAVAKEMLDNFNWYIIPVVNPDGYEFTRSDDRLWRKTRSKLSGTSCIGVDGNRNFGYHWGSDDGPCSESYPGPQAFSEPETMSMSDFMKAQKISKLLAFFSVHTYSKLWLLPYGYKRHTKPDDYKELYRVATVGVKALMRVNNQHWRYGNIVDELYVAAGNTVDYFKGEGLAKYTFVLELRGDDFIVPETEIDPSGHEVFAGFTAAVAAMKP